MDDSGTCSETLSPAFRFFLSSNLETGTTLSSTIILYSVLSGSIVTPFTSPGITFAPLTAGNLNHAGLYADLHILSNCENSRSR